MTTIATFEAQRIGPALVIGGSGFLGSHVVEQLLQEPSPAPITSASRKPRTGTVFDGVAYKELDLNNSAAVNELLADVQPEVVFYVAAPRAIDGANGPAVFHNTIGDGTRHVLEAATAVPCTKVTCTST